MKTYPQLLCVLAGLTAAVTGFAAESATKADQQTEVTFSHPEKFADVKDAYLGTEKGRDAVLSQLRDYIVQKAQKYVPAGDKLEVTVTDVDLAGDFEPWRGPEAQDVRIVKDIYPPKIDLEYKLVGPGGKAVMENKRQLRDLAFMMKLSINRDDNLRFEKALIDDWLRNDFQRAKSS